MSKHEPSRAEITRGMLLALITFMLYVGMDAVTKLLVADYPALQVAWARFVVHMAAVAILVAIRDTGLLVTRHPVLQASRSVLMMAASLFVMVGLRYVQLAESSAILYVIPLIVTALALPFLGERVGLRRWLGVAVGFAGALIVIRPGSGAFQAAALLPLGGAFCFALFQILTRALGRTSERSLTTLFYTPLAGAVVATVAVPFVWVAPDLRGWLLLAALGLLGGLANFTQIKSLELAPASTIAPFIYTNLVWATLYGYLLFGDLPDGWTVLGAAIIAGSGLYVFYRERARAAAGPTGGYVP